jgi:hypothetical protein
MYIHIGENKVLRKKDIAFVFDMDSSTVSVHTRNFLNKKEKEKKVINVSFELPKSFILVGDKQNEKIYISQISSATLNKRSGIIIK